MKEKYLIVFTDGGARGNPGPAAVGVVIKNSHGEKIIEFGQPIGRATNNVAEYQAVLVALLWLKENHQVLSGLTGIEFFLDSTLVVNQLNGKYKIKDLKLKNLIIKIKELEKNFSQEVSYNFIPRTKNYQADFLVNQTLDKQNG